MDLARTAELLWGTVVHRPYVYAFLVCFAAFAVAQLGIRRTATFAATAWAVAFVAEYSSTRNGFPFGPYRYFDETRTRELWISNVPFWDSLSFVFLAYFSLSLAGALLASAGERARRPEAGLLHRGAPVLGATLMTLLDVVIDPVALQGDKWFLGRIYEYPFRGFYFGVTAANFAGWWAVGAATQWLFQREVAALPWCRGAFRRLPPSFDWGVYGVYAGVFAFNLAVTIAIGDRALAVASGAVIAATLGAIGPRLRARRPARVLVCAATGREAAACRRGVAASGVGGVEVVRTGVGPERAGRALARRLAREASPPLVVSAGFAGALGAGVEIGEVVTGRAVHRLSGATPSPVALGPGALRPVPGVRPVDVVSAGSVLVGGTAWASGPAVVDMESAALAEAASARGAPFAVLRIVTDTPAAPLPPLARAAAVALASKGALRRTALTGRTLLEALRAPRAALALARASGDWAAAVEEALRGHAADLADLAIAAGRASGSEGLAASSSGRAGRPRL